MAPNIEKSELVEKIRKGSWTDHDDLKNSFLKLSKHQLNPDDVLWMMSEKDPMVSRYAYGLAKRFSIPGIIPALIEYMKGISSADRSLFIELLKDLNDPAQNSLIDELLKSSNVQDQALASQIVLSQPPQRVFEQLISLLGHSEIRYRFRSLHRVRQYLDVGMRPTERLHGAIQGLLDDPDAKIREIAERALVLCEKREPEGDESNETPDLSRKGPGSYYPGPLEDEQPAEHFGRGDEDLSTLSDNSSDLRDNLVVERPSPVPDPPKESTEGPLAHEKPTQGLETPDIAATGTDQVVAQPKAVPDIATNEGSPETASEPASNTEPPLRPVAAAPPVVDEQAKRTGHDEVFMELVRNLAHVSATVRANAMEEALAKNTPEEVLAGILKVLSTQADWIQYRVTQTLLEDDKDLLGTVLNLLRHDDVKVRRGATGFALNFSDYKMVTPCTENITDHDNIIRCMSLEILGRLDNPDVIDDILDALKKPAHRNFGIRALRSLPSPESQQQFLGFLKDRSPGTRLMAMWSLKGSKDERVRKYLHDMKDQDSHLMVRREAARVERQLGEQPPEDAPVDFSDTIGNQVVERTLDKLLQQVRESDNAALVIRPETQPMMRKIGKMEALSRVSLSAADTRRITQRILNEEEWAELQKNEQIVVGYDVPGTGRYKGSIYAEEGGFGAVFDTIPNLLPPPHELRIPKCLIHATSLSRGLLLLSGGPHSGRSTTLSSLVEHINSESRRFVVSLEQPIEYSHIPNESFLIQREIGRGCASFSEGIEQSIDQAADVIAVGQIVDSETMNSALRAAENGALVLGVLNATSFNQAVERAVSLTENSGGRNGLHRLGRNLVVLQHQGLTKRADGAGKVPFHSILLGNEAAGVILEEKALDLLPSLMHLATTEGMQTTESALLDLVRKGLVEPQQALRHAPNKSGFEKALDSLAEELG